MRRILALLLVGLGLAGCRATYTTGTVADTIREMCQREYGVDVKVLTAGKTIGAFLPVENLVQSDLSLSDGALDKVEHVMLTVSRVTLSSEFPYQFFTITAQDAGTGIRVTFIRFIKDIRRLLTDDISRNDYFQRMLLEVEFAPEGETGRAAAFTLREVSMGDFLARQLARRANQELLLNLVAARLFRVLDVEGAYLPVLSPGERTSVSGDFRLTLRFHPEAPPFESVADPALREDFLRLFFRTAQTLIRRYEFYRYDGLEIVDPDGRRLAYYDRQQFTRDTVNTLMELIRNLRPKEH